MLNVTEINERNSNLTTNRWIVSVNNQVIAFQNLYSITDQEPNPSIHCEILTGRSNKKASVNSNQLRNYQKEDDLLAEMRIARDGWDIRST